MLINPNCNLENLGGKGYNLNLLKSICNVPEFFVIKFDNLEEINEEEVQNKILSYYKKNHYNLVSVRSSATVEDSDQASFAGMFDSILNVKESNLIDSIKKVVKSAYGNRVIEYCKVKNIDHSKIGMRVIVQKMINSRVSGVCFTRTPKSNNLIMIEACLGLGEALVSGRVTPDNYIIDKDTLGIDDSSISYQKTMLKNTEYEEVPLKKRNTKKLTKEEIQNLIKISLQIDESLNFNGADIEWAIEDNKLYILQARAITFESKNESNKNVLPSIQNYQMTFKVTGLDFMFADLLCRGFGYLHPLFICDNGYFFQYFTNEKMKYAASYGYDWLSDNKGFDEYKKQFKMFHESSFNKLKEILEGKITSTNIQQFFNIIYEYFIFYSKMDFQFTNTTYLYMDKNSVVAENLQKLSAFKDVARVWINDVATDNNCLLIRFLSKISDNYHVDLDTLNLYKISELIDLANNKIVKKEIINERSIASVLMYDGQSIKYLTGENAVKYINDVKEFENKQLKADVSGQVANKGINKEVIGRVKIINVNYSDFEEMKQAINEMNEGDILVSESTAPELMAACAKAKAIVTDMGGMLSHAAIVSRELDIPCVVGTIHASRSLKDGDNIKINLDTGNIEIL